MGIVTPTLDQAFCDHRTGGMTVVDAVASGVTATRLREFGPTKTAQLLERIEHVLETVRMTDFRDRSVNTLSTGERRRVMIARAIVHEPEIFVMDEPTSGLDLVAAARFMEIVQSITERHQVTLLLVTHHLDEIPPAVDHVILLNRGRVVFDGGKAESLTAERLSSLYGVPIELEVSSGGWYRAVIAESLC
jgi:iron complex transport system ATP-binding protein